MNIICKALFALAILLSQDSLANATTISYSKEVFEKSNTFRMTNATTQGQAIRIPKAKLQIFKGKAISSIDFVLGTKNVANNTIHAFISTSLDGEPVAEADVVVTKALTKTNWQLQQPYIITGDEDELYIGYTANVNMYRALVADGGLDIQGYNFALGSDGWVDTYRTGRGSACIFANIDTDVDYVDAILGEYDFSGYYKAGNNNLFAIDILNGGTMPINSFDAVVSVNGIRKVRHLSNLNIAPKDAYTLELTDIDTGEEGNKDVELTIANLNGGNNDIDDNDNNMATSVFFYPHNMERSVLVENFTGQGCSGCPSGHAKILQAIRLNEEKTGDEIVEVSHHAGYFVDIFTMAEDNDLRFFYPNPDYTYAPAVMANRLVYSEAKAPIRDASNYDDIVNLIDFASASHPLASLSLESSFDKDSRLLKVKFQIKPHEKLPASAVFNVLLVQDSISAYQSNGGVDYKHNRVYRGTLTGNAFGIPVDHLNVGETSSWNTSFTIPAKIHSSLYTDDMLEEVEDSRGNKKLMYVYTSPISLSRTLIDVDQSNVDAITDNMSIVAYVAEYDKDDNTKNAIYNSIEAKVGESHTHAAFYDTSDVDAVADDGLGEIYVSDGRVRVDGSYDKLFIYSLSGVAIDKDSSLSKGVYIVKTIYKGRQTTKKILVR